MRQLELLSVNGGVAEIRPSQAIITYSNNYNATGDLLKTVGEQVVLHELKLNKCNPGLYKGNEYFVLFSDFNGTFIKG
jgi:hypothetical protein